MPLGKLPDTVVPVAYRLDLTIDPAAERFSGTVEIDARLAAPTSAIFLHGRDLAVHRATAWIAGEAVAGKWRQVDSTGVAELRFASQLPAGPVRFAFEYNAPFGDSPAGMFRVKVGEDWYSWTQFESIDARAAFPSFDEPGFKTPFTITLRSPPGLVAVSNAPELSATRDGALEVHRFRETLPLPTYLVAMMVGPFATLAGEVSPSPQRAKPLPLRIVSTRQNADRLTFPLQGSKEIVALLEAYFGEAFPFPKLDQISTPILPGAMENAGADLYNDTILIVGENSPVRRKRNFGMIVSHELAHQWFGDLVTPAWWDDIWLNESFANWMGYRIGAEWRPDLKIAAGASAEGFAAMNTDALLAGRPIRQPIVTNSQIDSAFDSITYGKGGQVVAMIASFMGDDKFREGVRGYMAAHRLGSATSTDFFAALAKAAGDPRIVPALRSFTDQQGVPLLTFTQKGDQFIVTQSRYAPLGVNPPPIRWSVPLCVRRSGVRQCQLLDSASAEFTIKAAGPLMPNLGGAGYYRFELARRGWDALIAIADRLGSGEAQALADSLLASFRAGRATTPQLVALAKKLVRNPDSHASDAAAWLLDGLTSAELVDSSATTAYRALVGRLFRPQLARLGFDPRAGAYAGGDPDTVQRRVLAVKRLTNGGRDKSLRRTIAVAAGKYLAGDAAALDPVWYEIALGAYLETGGLPGAKAIIDQALASQDAEFRPAAIEAVAESGNAEIATWLLDDLKDERLRKNEARALLAGVIGTRATRDFGYTWLRAHLAKLTAGNDGIFFSSRLPQLLNGFCSVERSREFDRDLRAQFASKSGELEFARAVERVRNCGVLHDTMAAVVSAEMAALQ